MIVIKNIKFSNMFSYGKDNVFEVTDPVTQLVGRNGNGKSSIASILEEALYNKNSRGIKKADVVNRYCADNGYEVSVDFSANGVNYSVVKAVTSSAKVKLFEEGADISGHTATQTYAKIESILQLDFPTFTKLVNQSMVSSLDFLSATDTNRKKFLVSLLGLEQYVEAEKVTKEALKEAKNELAMVEGSLRTAEEFLKANPCIPETVEEVEVPQADPMIDKILIDRKTELANIEMHNREATRNIKLKTDYEKLISNVVAPCLPSEDDEEALKREAQELKTQAAVQQSKITKLSAVKSSCPTCGQSLDIGSTKEMLAQCVASKDSITAKLLALETKLKAVIAKNTKYLEYKTYLDKVAKAEEAYDPRANTNIESAESLTKTISEISKQIAKVKSDIAKAQEFNKNAAIQNDRAKQIKAQLDTYTLAVEDQKAKLDMIQDNVSDISILSEAFGTKGLIAYKIESVIKLFEELIHGYLQELSDGRFTLSFQVEDSKLKLKIYDNSIAVDIKSLSSGEFNKVSTSCLLAIRKMMASIAKTNINLLFLDEVISVLDDRGRDTLIELLLKEEGLNSVIVSHGYTHPLSATINVVKQDNVSTLQQE